MFAEEPETAEPAEESAETSKETDPSEPPEPSRYQTQLDSAEDGRWGLVDN